MPTLTPVSVERHAGKAWRKPNGFAFASHLSRVPVTVNEMPRLVARVPVAFVAEGDAFVAVGLLGPGAGRNVGVDADGRWLLGDPPSILRAYPLRLAHDGSGERMLCIEDEDQTVLEGLSGGEPFFGREGLSTATKAAFDFLVQIDGQLAQTSRIAAKLANAKVLCPWNVAGSAKESLTEDLYRVDEEALSALDQDQFLELRRAGALPVAYMQLLSIGRIPLLRQLALTPPTTRATTAKESGDSKAVRLVDDGLLRFD